ncbi:hypothetical protein COW46_03295 [Candidatus Gracilibacteria bacterium CG17_big_fil_post_rev_8_21_14_2_50_48_13]|nr:MAG: hypothetical protein COW46_03295 [Candidatus Gracilibacteria bacterium CG17_big_fil_post_rev_8_21_14_2_50_48_13]
MDMFRRVALALESESETPQKKTALPAPQNKRLHVLLLLLKKYMQQSKRSDDGLPLASIDRIIHLLRANLHHFEKMRLAKVREEAKQRTMVRR